MARKQKMILCKNCDGTMAKEAKVCPSCGAKNKKPFYKRWWFVLIVIVIALGLMLSGGDGGEKIDWSDIELGEMLPEPKSNRGNIITNREDDLTIYLNKTSKEDYKAYVDACESMGYTVEAKKNGDDYEAYNEEGYMLRLWYAQSNEEMHINLEAPEELGTLQWPNSDLAQLLPQPASAVGKISRESSDGFYIYVGETDLDDFNEYVAQCSAAGFDVDYEKGDEYYRAYDESGNYVSLLYAGNHVMTIEMRKAEEEPVVEEPVAEETVLEEPVTEESSGLVDGMRPEFKEAMDAYEKFMDEYCEFMKKYAESDGSDLGLLVDYAKYMSDYAEFVDSYEKWDAEEMNTKETAYYIDVQARVNKKLLEVVE